MADRRDVVIIGGGHNGLVAAGYLARAGLRPLVLERRALLGGVAATEEFHPGFRAPAVLDTAGLFQESFARDLDLTRHGLATTRAPVRLFAPSSDGSPPLTIFDDPRRTERELAAISPKDASRWVEFTESVARIGALLSPLLTTTPPPLDAPGVPDLWKLLGLGRGFRRLPKKDAHRLLRWGPMAVADLAAEWFDSERLRAIVSARGVFGAFAGPWSAGTSANLLLQAAARARALLSGAARIAGGPGGLVAALAASARASGAEVRTGAEVARITVEGGAATGVVLASGEEIAARAVVSGADPKRTLLALLDPMHLDPDFLGRVRSYRSLGSAGKVRFALSDLPRFSGADPAEATASLSGMLHIGPDVDYLERAFDAAKYGGFSPAPYIEATMPSLLDPEMAPKGAHVLSAHVQYAPYDLKGATWEAAREALGDAVTAALARVAPGFPALVVARQILTPRDLEETYGLTGGHVFHGEHSLDQLYAMRPVLGWARYRTPVRGLYLCGAGTHPGGGVIGACGANASREVLKDWKRRDSSRARSAPRRASAPPSA